MSDIWSYRDDIRIDTEDVVGYDVEATDGDLGKIDKSSTDAGQQHVVVDTGFWIFGEKRLIPAGAITMVDHDDKKVTVSMTKDQIKSAPEYDESQHEDTAYRSSHEDYYRPHSSR
ncbi:hypothetical protein BH23ACT3_BH23ACT3_21330 [soil metagenome]